MIFIIKIKFKKCNIHLFNFRQQKKNMRIYFKQSSLFVICLICILLGIYTWKWWQGYV